jgi:hypothetical protein
MSVQIIIHTDTAAEAVEQMRDFLQSSTVIIDRGPLAEAIDEKMAALKVAAPEAETVTDRPDDSPELDSAGVPFDPEIHTGTKLKDGTWRTRKGAASAAAPTPAEPSPSAEDAGTASASDAVESSDDEEDEFAAFKEAAAEPATTAEVPARSWTDADLSKLLSQAVTKMGGGEAANKARSIIAEYCEGDVTPHSRHIPEAKREEFAQRIEEWADIEFAG